MAPIVDFSIESILADTSSGNTEKQASQPSSKGNAEERPQFTHSALIVMAIRSSEKKRLTLSEICSWVEANFPYYRENKHSWQNSLRHTLSVNENFVKVPRPMDDPGRGWYWKLSAAAENVIIGESTGRLRNVEPMPCSNGFQYQQSPFLYWHVPQLQYPPVYFPTPEGVQHCAVECSMD